MNNILIDPSEERRILDLRLLGFRDVMVIGQYVYNKARMPLEIHCHGELMEICYLAEGQQFYKIEDEDFFLNGGDVLINYPHEQHGTGFQHQGRGHLFWLIVSPPVKRSDYLGISFENGKLLWDSFQQLPGRHFRANHEAKKILESIFSLIDTTEPQLMEQNPFLLLNVRSLLLRLLIDLVMTAKSQPKPEISVEIQRVIETIKENAEIFFTMKKLGSIAGLSESRFKHRFREEVGISPADFQIRHKIKLAGQMLLRSEQTILDTALDLGFSSSQYFSTVFRRYQGMSPAQFRNLYKV